MDLGLRPDHATIRDRLGRESGAFHEAGAHLRERWAEVGSIPAMAGKRRQWAAQLQCLHGRAADSDALWVQHTYLVMVARCIAVALNQPPPDLAPFDWVDDGPIRRIQEQVDQFRLAEAEGDILQVLYASLIDRDDRHGLGEYYTPDWLAAKVVREAVQCPQRQKVLDPACGSGTFLFHAIRHVLAATVDLPPQHRVATACAQVTGMDIHPVAVIIARTTCLLALAPVLDARRDLSAVPVTLSDALQPAAGNGDVPVGNADVLVGNADVLVGNPPWVAFRHLASDQRRRLREQAAADGVYVGGRFATQNDVCAVFTVRAASLHLRPGGRLGFVLPLAVLSRGQFAPLRRGAFPSLNLAWDAVWTLDETVAPLFPVPCCVLFGHRCSEASGLPERVTAFSGTLPCRDLPESLADAHLVVQQGPVPVAPAFSGGSPYRTRFRQGATLVPRMLCLVYRPTGSQRVSSRRSALEKPPWKTLPGVDGEIEAAFLRPVLLGESILPYRLFRPFEGVVPVDGDGLMLDAAASADRGFDGLHRWMRQAEAVWTPRAAMPLVGRWNYHNGLTAQFPIAPLRVVYAKGGTHPAACLLHDDRAVIDHMLYWMARVNEDEGRYLLAVLNSGTARARAAGFQARGQFGARHFDKVMFNLSIPCFLADNPLHRALADAAAAAEEVAGQVVLPDGVTFQRARGLVRNALAAEGLAARIDRLVATLLDEG